MKIKEYIDKYTSKPWFWYAVIGIATISFYPHIVKLLSEQFSVYSLHFGNPATYIFVYIVYGLWFGSYYPKRWGHGKMGWRGNILLFAGALIILVILVKVFGYKLLGIS